MPLLVSSVTTVAAFLPLFLLSGASGEYAFSLAAVVALTLGGSWITALYILPALTVWLLGRSGVARQTRTRPARVAGALRFHITAPPSAFRPSSWPHASGLVVLAVTLFDRLPKQMFPLSERNQFLVYMNMPDGTDISQTEASALEVSKWLADPAAKSRGCQPDPLRGGWRPKVLPDI